MKYIKIQSDFLEQAALDLMSIPPFIHRSIRRKLVKTTIADIDMDITHRHFEIIKLLEEEGTLHVAKIGKKLQIAKAQMTQLIEKLVELNLVERGIDTLDRRIINISLSVYGKTVLGKNKIRMRNAIKESMSLLSDKDLKDLSDSLRKIQSILSKLN